MTGNYSKHREKQHKKKPGSMRKLREVCVPAGQSKDSLLKINTD